MDMFSQSSALCHKTHGPLFLGVGWGLLGVAMLIVAARIFVRMRAGKGIHSDDYFVVASLVSGATGIVGGVFLTLMVREGGGRHISCLPLGQIYPLLKWTLFAQIFNVLGIGLVKISVCLCVLRLIDRARRRLSQFLWVLVAFVAASHFVQVLIFLLQCRPLNALWDPKVEGKCFSTRLVYTAGYANYGLDAATDLICAGIPVFVFHQLQMNRRTKIALSILMSLGVVTEHYLGISIASIPTLKNLFAKLLDITVSSQTSSKSFQKITPVFQGLSVPQSQMTSGRSSIRGSNIRVQHDFRFSSQLELASNSDYEMSQGSVTSWAQGPSRGRGHDPAMRTGGYKHIDDKQHLPLVPQTGTDVHSEGSSQ
ncbi:MAG: hypothetical protein Q9170_001415 [Blastenia crenularia]